PDAPLPAGWSTGDGAVASARLPSAGRAPRRPRVPESLPPDLVALRDRLTAFIEEMRPLERDLASAGEDGPAPGEAQRRVRERSKELGFFGMTQPKEFGGTEAGALALTVARETLAAANTPLARFVFGPDPG